MALVRTMFSSACAVLGASGASGQYTQQAHSHGSWAVQTTAVTLIAASASIKADAHTLPRHQSSSEYVYSGGSQQSDTTGSSAWYSAVLPTSFEAADHASSAEFEKLRQWWGQDSEDDTVVYPSIAGETPAVVSRAGTTTDAWTGTTAISALDAHHFRGGEEAATVSVSDCETIEAVAVTVSMPLVHRSDVQWVQLSHQHVETLDELLGSPWHLSNQQPLFLDRDVYTDADNSFFADEVLQVEPAQFTLGLEGLSAWALCAYVSVVSVLFLVTLMWLAFILVRAGLSMLVNKLLSAAYPAGDDTPAHAMKCDGTDSCYDVVEVHCEKVSAPLLRA